MKFNHIGIFVKEINKGLLEFKKFIKIKKKSNLVEDKKLKVKVMFITDENNLCYELIEPFGKNNPVTKTLEKRVNIINHLAYETKSFEKNIKVLTDSGFRAITKPTKAKAFSGRRIIFLINKLNFIIELIEA